MSGVGIGPSRLKPDFGVWGLFGWQVLAFVGSVLVIPSPWTSAALYRYMVSHVRMPDGTPLVFRGRGGDIWYWFMLSGALGLIGQVFPVLSLLAVGAGPIIFTFILRWLAENCGSDDNRVSIRFEGDSLSMFGWTLLTALSFLTIVGWAWVFKYQARWICEKVTGSHRFTFQGAGISILWRFLVFLPGCALIIPIPWLFRWLTAWFVGQIGAEPNRA